MSETSFNPSCRVRIQLRLEEGTDQRDLLRSIEQSPQGVSASIFNLNLPGLDLQTNFITRSLLAGASLAGESILESIRQLDEARDTAFRFLLNQVGIESIRDTDDGRSVVLSLIPRTCTINRNDLDAWTAEIELDFKDIPIDPRMVRACFVSVILGEVDVTDYDKGTLEQKRRSDGSLYSVIERKPEQELDTRSTTRFVGIANEWSVEFSEESDVVRIPCSDLSILLREIKLPPQVRLDQAKPLVDGIRELVDKFPGPRGINIAFGPGAADSGGPIPAASLSQLQAAKQGQARATTKNGSKTSTREINLWDHLVDITRRLGYVIFVQGYTLKIILPRDLYGDNTNRAVMAFGRNLASLGFNRKLSGIRTQTVEIRSPDPEIGRSRWARFPVPNGERKSGVLGITDPVAARPNTVYPSGKSEDKVLTFLFPGVTNTDTLETIAESVYQEQARQEISGNFTTYNITSLGSKTPGDLLNLSPGDAVTILQAEAQEPVADTGGGGPFQSAANIAQGGLSLDNLAGALIGGGKPLDPKVETEAQRLNNFNFSQRRDYYIARGFTEKMAGRLARVYNFVSIQNTFRAKYVTLNWSYEDGISIDCNFVNFIVIKEPEAVSEPEVDTAQQFAEKAVKAEI